MTETLTNDETAKLQEWKDRRLKSGLHLPDYKFASLPGYWKTQRGTARQRKPTTYKEVQQLSRPNECPWQFESWDKKTGELYERFIVHNVITDNGAISMLKNTWNNAGSAVAIMNHLVISPNGCSTTLTSATGVSPITTLAVAALPAALSSGLTMTIGYGGGTTQTVTLNGSVSIGATSITVTSFTPSTNYPIGTAVVAIPGVTDNPSSVSGSVDSGALSGGAFTFNATTGLGNRNVVIVVTFTGTTGNAGTYTEAYTSNNATIATGTTASHTIFPGFVLGSSSNETITLTEKA